MKVMVLSQEAVEVKHFPALLLPYPFTHACKINTIASVSSSQ